MGVFGATTFKPLIIGSQTGTAQTVQDLEDIPVCTL